MTDRQLDLSTFFEGLTELPASQQYWIALSGGMDSTALLHLMWATREQHKAVIKAIHINHNLQQQADDWQRHVEQFCAKLNIELVCHKLNEQPPAGDSIENWARQQRLHLFQQIIPQDDCVLLAHHQNDQAETLLLQLFRGSGIPGLAAMPDFRMHRQLKIGRPLINFNQQQIADYIQRENLSWLEDDSNTDERFDRNFLRHKIIPLLTERWPAINKTLARSSSHQAEAQALLVKYANEQLAHCYFENTQIISLAKLNEYDDLEKKNILRQWFYLQIGQYPSDKIINEIFTSVIKSDPNAQPFIKLHSKFVRRYLDALFIVPEQNEFKTDNKFNWKLDKPLQLANGILSIRKQTGQGIRKESIENGVTIRFRQPGDKIKIKIQNAQHHIDLKILFQNKKVLPWMRACIPLLSLDDKLICVPGLCVADSVAVNANEVGYVCHWQPYQEWRYPECKS